MAEFHTEIERLDYDEIHTDIYIRHPIQIEQYLMEGNYNKVHFLVYQTFQIVKIKIWPALNANLTFWKKNYDFLNIWT